jgi:hypothetical protein
MIRTAITALAALTISAPAAIAQDWDFRTDRNSPKLYAPNGQFLGNANRNPYDPNSIANPYGRYGSQYSPNSVNNPYGQYGNPYSQQYSNPNGRR